MCFEVKKVVIILRRRVTRVGDHNKVGNKGDREVLEREVLDGRFGFVVDEVHVDYAGVDVSEVPPWRVRQLENKLE
jgi:hypothetical protein